MAEDEEVAHGQPQVLDVDDEMVALVRLQLVFFTHFCEV
jgi:hypothetical protein